MSYLHCPACSRAYNAATHPTCPQCPAAAPADRGDDIASAVDRLVRALAGSTPAERAAAAACMHRLGEAISPERALTPVPHRAAPRRRPLLAAIAVAVLDRIAPHAPRRLSRVVERVKALAA